MTMLKTYYFQLPSVAPKLQFQDYDLAILKLMDSFRVLDSELTYALLKRGFPTLPYDTFKRRLQKLTAARLLIRPEEQVILAVRHGQRHLVYTLSRQGAEFLKGQLSESEWQKLKTFKRVQSRKGWEREQNPSYRFLEHSLEIARFRAALELSEKLSIPLWLNDREFKNPVRFREAANWYQKKLVKGMSRDHEGKYPLSIIPDSFFAIQGRGSQLLWHALEIDRSTEPTTDLAKKILAYYKALKALKEKHEPLLAEDYPVCYFRVLFVAPDQRRVEQLKEIVRSVEEGSHVQGHRAFWFTTRDKIDWRRPETAIDRVWQTAPGDQFSLLD
jgi:hypothetical protein